MLNIISQVQLNHAICSALYRSHMETLGARLRKLRLHHHLNQDQFGDLCGVTKGAVSQWESDLTVPDMPNLLQLTQKLSFSLDWLLIGLGTMNHGLDPTRQKLLQVAQTLPDYAVVRLTEEGNSYAQLIEQAQTPKVVNGDN